MSDDVVFSQRKLQAVADSLATWVPTCRQMPKATQQDCAGYRCRCSFQCVWTEDDEMHFAVRRQHEPILVDSFPIANNRIQRAMAELQVTLNNNREIFSALRVRLTSVSFSSAWSDTEDSDLLLTLLYDSAIQDPDAWKAAASVLCSDLKLSQVTGRSRKCIWRARDVGDSIIRDTLWLWCRSDAMEWHVSLAEPQPRLDNRPAFLRTVRYERPEEAFSHPNAGAMCLALAWLLQRISWICCRQLDRRATLLEMYCGCGAHTIALVRTNLLAGIVAIELDERLVDACRRNYALNREDETTSMTTTAATATATTTLEIVSADAGVWARSSACRAFDILLVDPPRHGLDEQVCCMAKDGRFQHLLYISCGCDALVRDLGRLSSEFEVVDCTLLDLFPRTNAVETLVHLRRRQG